MRALASGSPVQERHVIESDMVEAGFALRNRRIEDLMRPRAAIAWLDVNQPAAEHWHTIATADQDAFPVCRGGLDHVLGVIGSQQVRAAFVSDGRLDRMERLEKPLRLPRTLHSLAALEAMQPTRTELALVVDEDGRVVGAVTARSLQATLAAEIFTGIRPVRTESIPRADGSWLLDGLLPIAELRARFRLGGASDPRAERYHTLAGLVLSQFGRLPAVGEAIEWHGLRIEIVDLDGRRIDKLLVTPLARRAGQTALCDMVGSRS